MKPPETKIENKFGCFPFGTISWLTDVVSLPSCPVKAGSVLISKATVLAVVPCVAAILTPLPTTTPRRLARNLHRYVVVIIVPRSKKKGPGRAGIFRAQNSPSRSCVSSLRTLDGAPISPDCKNHLRLESYASVSRTNCDRFPSLFIFRQVCCITLFPFFSRYRRVTISCMCCRQPRNYY